MLKPLLKQPRKIQVALEINNSSFLHSRKGSEDNCRAVAAAVRDAGGWVALGSDSHTAFTMGEFEECLEIPDAVDFPPERILNVSPRRLLNFLESRGYGTDCGICRPLITSNGNILMNEFSILCRVLGSLYYRQPQDPLLGSVCFTLIREGKLAANWPLGRG